MLMVEAVATPAMTDLMRMAVMSGMARQAA